MLRAVGLLLILSTMPAGAQEYSASFTMQEWVLIGEALGAQPFKVVAPVVSKLNTQISAAQKAERAAEIKRATEAEKAKSDGGK